MVLRSGGTTYRYGYQGAYAEKDGETDWNAFELRMYDSRIARWLTTDPKDQFASPYIAMGNDPVNGMDKDGGDVNSIHTDANGKVLAIYNDGDMGVYMHADAHSAADIAANWSMSNTSAGGELMGTAWTPFGFANFENFQKQYPDGNPPKGAFIQPDLKAKIDFGSNWATNKVDAILSQDPTAFGYGYNARSGHEWDIKQQAPGKNPYYGSLLYGQYASARDAGNMAAGAVEEMSWLPNGIIDYGYGTYNKSGNKLWNSTLSLAKDYLKMLIDPIQGIMDIHHTATKGENILSQDGIDAGKYLGHFYQEYKVQYPVNGGSKGGW